MDSEKVAHRFPFCSVLGAEIFPADSDCLGNFHVSLLI